MSRINFVAEQVGNTNLPGVQAIVNRLQKMGVLEPEQLVDNCLDLLGPVEVGADTKKVLTEQAKQWGQIRWDTPAQGRRRQAHRRAVAADRGDPRISIRLRIGQTTSGGNQNGSDRRIPCWSWCN